MNANELIDILDKYAKSGMTSSIANTNVQKIVTMLRQQQNEIEELETELKNVWKVVEGKQTEIDRLNYDMEGFKQNFFVSGFHLQIKMANEQLLKQQEQIDALKSELDRAVELYTDKAIENEVLEKELTEAGHMIGVLREYISDLENGLDSSIKLNKAQAERTHPVKDKPHPKCDEACMYLCQMRELTDEEIIAVGNAVVNHIDSNEGWIEFARAILRKASEK